MSFTKKTEYEFETIEEAMDYIEDGFGNQQPYDTGGQMIWGSVETGADVILNEIENKTE